MIISKRERCSELAPGSHFKSVIRKSCGGFANRRTRKVFASCSVGAATGLPLATPILMMLAEEVVSALLANVVMRPRLGACLTLFPVLFEIILGRLRHGKAGRR